MKEFLKYYFSDDHSRVVLDKVDGDPDSDYINANWIDVSAAIGFCLDILSKIHGIPEIMPYVYHTPVKACDDSYDKTLLFLTGISKATRVCGSPGM